MTRKKFNTVEARRKEIIMGRLRGESSVTLASRLGVSIECVSRMYRSLPKRPTLNGNSTARLVPADDEVICKVCADYLDGASIDQLMQEYNLSRDDLMSCMYAVSDRVSSYTLTSNRQGFAFDLIGQKRNELNLSLNVVAGEVGVSVFLFNEILKGWRHMPFDVASKLADMLDVSVTEIWSEALVPTAKLYKRGEKAHRQRRVKAFFCAAVEKDSVNPEYQDTVYWIYYRYMRMEAML